MSNVHKCKPFQVSILPRLHETSISIIKIVFEQVLCRLDDCPNNISCLINSIHNAIKEVTKCGAKTFNLLYLFGPNLLLPQLKSIQAHETVFDLHTATRCAIVTTLDVRIRKLMARLAEQHARLRQTGTITGVFDDITAAITFLNNTS